MEDFVNFLRQNKSLIIGIMSSLIAFFSFIESFLLWRLTGSLRKTIAAARKRGTYTVCPRCGTEIKLSEVDFRLPDGSIDNDLNGKPDKLE